MVTLGTSKAVTFRIGKTSLPEAKINYHKNL